MQNMKRVNFNMDNDLYMKMKIKSMEAGKTFTAELLDLIIKHCALPIEDRAWDDLTLDQQEQRAIATQSYADSLDRPTS